MPKKRSKKPLEEPDEERTEDPRHVPEAFADTTIGAALHEGIVRVCFGSYHVDIRDPDAPLVRIVSCRVALTELAVGELCNALAELALVRFLDEEEAEPGEKPN